MNVYETGLSEFRKSLVFGLAIAAALVACSPEKPQEGNETAEGNSLRTYFIEIIGRQSVPKGFVGQEDPPEEDTLALADSGSSLTNNATATNLEEMASSGLGTILKKQNKQSRSLSADEQCFLPNGKYKLNEETRYAEDDAEQTSSILIHLTNSDATKNGCKFEKGYVPSDSVIDGNDRWVRPATGPITSDHGKFRRCPGKCSNPHQGIDYGVAKGGSPTYAARGGRVVWASFSGGLGNLVAVQHTVGSKLYTSRYGHHRAFVKNAQKGSQVSGGQQVGVSGCTGTCSGDHLHFDLTAGHKTPASGGWMAEINPHSLSKVFR